MELTDEHTKTTIINMLNMFKYLKGNMNVRAKMEDIFKKKTNGTSGDEKYNKIKNSQDGMTDTTEGKKMNLQT